MRRIKRKTLLRVNVRARKEEEDAEALKRERARALEEAKLAELEREKKAVEKAKAMEKAKAQLEWKRKSDLKQTIKAKQDEIRDLIFEDEARLLDAELLKFDEMHSAASSGGSQMQLDLVSVATFLGCAPLSLRSLRLPPSCFCLKPELTCT